MDKNGRWNFSNFRKHMKIHTIKGKEQEGVEKNEFDASTQPHEIQITDDGASKPCTVQNIDASDLMKLPIDLESYGLHFDTEAVQITTDTVLTTTDTLYKQSGP